MSATEPGPHDSAPRRRFDHTGGWRLDRATFEAAIGLLADGISGSAPAGTAQPVVVGIGGGGREPAARLAGRLGVDALLVHARHNPTNASYTQATGDVHVDVADLVAGLGDRRLSGQVLLVDDICGTGATLAAVVAALTPHLDRDAAVTGVALCRNTAALTDLLNYWVFDVSDWVYFPWEQQPAAALTARPLPHPYTVHTT